MSETLTLKDGTFTTLFSERDFEELIDTYMGPEAARCFRALMDELERLREYDNEL